jgi:ribosomal protein S14
MSDDRDDPDQCDTCDDCGNPLGPYNMTGICRVCLRVRQAECRHERASKVFGVCPWCRATVDVPALTPTPTRSPEST